MTNCYTFTHAQLLQMCVGCMNILHTQTEMFDADARQISSQRV